MAKGVHLTRFLNYNVHGTAAAANQPPTRDTTTYTGDNPFSPALGDVFVTNSRGHGLYRGLTLGVRRRFAQKYQFEANYVLSKDEDDDSNERDPFTDRSFNFYDLSLDYGPSDRDIRHRVNFYTYAELPKQFLINVRAQARTAQPITTSPRVLNGDDRGRNWDRKDNAYFSLDWRLQRPFKFGGRYEVIPTMEMFNTFNNANNVNPLTTPLLFDFNGFLRSRRGRSAPGAAVSEADVLTRTEDRGPVVQTITERAPSNGRPRAISPLRRTIDSASACGSALNSSRHAVSSVIVAVATGAAAAPPSISHPPGRRLEHPGPAGRTGDLQLHRRACARHRLLR